MGTTIRNRLRIPTLSPARRFACATMGRSRQITRLSDGLDIGRRSSRLAIEPLGLALNPVTGEIWKCEDGPNGGDEINVLQAGKNYGWPVVSFGRFYPGPRVTERPWQEGMEQPLVFWGARNCDIRNDVLHRRQVSELEASVIVGGMRTEKVPCSGHLERIYFNDKWEELHREGCFVNSKTAFAQRRQGPDGFLYLLTAETTVH